MRSVMNAAGRRVWSVRVLLVASALLLAACPRQKPVSVKAEDVKREPARSLGVGEKAVFEFATDGNWHVSPYVALSGHSLQIRSCVESTGVADQAVRFRIARLPQMVHANQPFSITMPGTIYFKVDRRFVGEEQRKAKVEVERLE